MAEPALAHGPLAIGPTQPAPFGDELAERLAHLAEELAGPRALPELAACAVESALALLPQGGCALCASTGTSYSVLAASGEAERALQQREFGLGDGPTLAALRGEPVVNVGELLPDGSWPRFAVVARSAGVRSMLAVRLEVPQHRPASLSFYAPGARAFDSEHERTARLAGMQIAAALSRVLNEENLRTAVQTRQQIGEAVGILVERRRITPDEAFETLVHASQDHNIKLRDVAQLVVETGQEPGPAADGSAS